jgi:hypothetical protein
MHGKTARRHTRQDSMDFVTQILSAKTKKVAEFLTQNPRV